MPRSGSPGPLMERLEAVSDMVLRRTRIPGGQPALLLGLLLSGCNDEKLDGPAPATSVAVGQPGTPHLPPELAPKPNAATPAPAAPEAPVALSVFPKQPEHAGPWFVVTSPAAGVYSEPSFERRAKLGWVRAGGRLPLKGKPVSTKNCTGGWYELVGGGYTCGNYGTTNLAHPDVKFAQNQPKLEDVLPYPYARNAKNGTPLYKTVPSREQMLRYEPYLEKKKDEAVAENGEGAEKSAEKPPAVAAEAAAGDAVTRPASIGAIAALAGAAIDPTLTEPGLEAEAAAPETPWWQQENIKDRLHEVTLSHLEADADDLLAKRMVQGFYVAVDRTFRWNDRTWYKTTKGLVTPSERFWQTAGPTFKGVELDGTTLKLPMAWGYGGRKQVASYKIDPETQKLENAKSYERRAPLVLTGKKVEIAKTEYVETSEGTWVKSAHVRITEPGAPPAGLASDERWIEVDLSSQTLIAYVGTRPVYATMISSGKQSKIKEKDHRTPTGEFRVREEHITTTMDGDGSAAGDLPYSIEDVPYVMYYHKAYALHGAFWHSNFGTQMSHGCVNLAPLDAKYLFFFANPDFRAGFHGMWSRPENAGARIVIHD